MSAIATFIALPQAKMPLLETANDTEEVEEQGREIELFEGSGFVLVSLLPMLADEYGIDLISTDVPMSDDLAPYVQVILPAQKKWLSRLEESNFSEDSLRQKFKNYGDEYPEVGAWLLKGIRFLARGIAALKEDEIGLLHIAF